MSHNPRLSAISYFTRLWLCVWAGKWEAGAQDWLISLLIPHRWSRMKRSLFSLVCKAAHRLAHPLPHTHKHIYTLHALSHSTTSRSFIIFIITFWELLTMTSTPISTQRTFVFISNTVQSIQLNDLTSSHFNNWLQSLRFIHTRAHHDSAFRHTPPRMCAENDRLDTSMFYSIHASFHSNEFMEWIQLILFEDWRLLFF